MSRRAGLKTQKEWKTAITKGITTIATTQGNRLSRRSARTDHDTKPEATLRTLANTVTTCTVAAAAHARPEDAAEAMTDGTAGAVILLRTTALLRSM